MRIVLTDKELDMERFPSDVDVQKISYKSMDSYNHNGNVVAIAGSRAMAIKANGMDLPGLKFFQLTSAGFDGVPLKEMAEKGITVANAGSTYSAPIAETVVMGMLLMAKRLHPNPNNRHAKIQRHYSEIHELFEKKAMILGAGSIGTEIAKRLSGFDMVVDGYAQRQGNRPFFHKVICGRENLMECLSEYDYVISTLPDNEHTRGFVDSAMLRQMRKNTIIVNVGRKAVLDESALYLALKTNTIGGAVLDMFEKIPNPITNKFRRLGNVIVLPGVAAISQEVNMRLREHIYKNLLASITGEKVQYIINGVK